MPALARMLNLHLPTKQSAFLWGARKTGKSTFLKTRFPDSIYFDFLNTDLFVEFSKRPALLRERLYAMDKTQLRHPIILDEVQKVPQILDEVHGLIENKGWRFILCGSSARKLKRGQANLLGGRAWRYEMFPLVTPEIDQFDLLRGLNHGFIPDHYLQIHAGKSLQAYVQDYLKEEVFAEGLTRQIPAFSRFFDAMAYSHGEITNFSSIARDCGVDSKTVKEYYQILVDTLIGTVVPPFRRRQNRQVLTKASKFYLFDVGVAGAIIKRRLREERGEAFGKAFEHFILMELLAHRSYHEMGYSIQFWRTKTGLEIDFILGEGEVAVEIKGTSRVDSRDLRALSTFVEDYNPRLAIIVCNEREERRSGPITIKPWRVFLRELWEDKIIR